MTSDGPPHSREWRDGELVGEGFGLDGLAERLSDPDAVLWLDVGASDADGLAAVARALGLDRLAVEDAASRHERTKLDRYHDYVFLNVYAPALRDDGRLAFHEVSVFVTPQALVTVRQDDRFDLRALLRRWDDDPDVEHDRGAIAEHEGGTLALLLYGLLDLIVDQQLDIVGTLDEQTDELEELIFETPSSAAGRDVQERSFRLRKNLARLRRVALPMREVLNTLLRRDVRLVAEPLLPYYQDVYDHALRVAEETESLRDLVADLLDTRIALQGNRMNEVMKQVTSWAAIIAVPTAVTGFYGQNVHFPGEHTVWGFVTSTSLMVLCVVVLYRVFKQRDWL
ncbi:magnesium transporter CorA family protein [Actinomadura flavalba]|uniref:magnesium transporter CorA family protein n=1 Tax=Actinomadura flavalba TaxID=1120938 RepID=UPI0003614DCC|nr:magnesium transporter CorA family protein [Actinomadura flavalba]